MASQVIRRAKKWDKLVISLLLLLSSSILHSSPQDFLTNLGRNQDFKSKRISSFDTTGGNHDAISIEPGETAVLAEIEGPAAIHHIWVTISAEHFYGRKIVLRMYWDGEEDPSVEVPIGDFFGVGHGLNRNFSSIPINCSSHGRARNCYWYMPFRKSVRITATNEGTQPVWSFYYYVDYRELPRIGRRTPYFHAQYRQETPCVPGRNYLFLEAEGKGHYVGCNLSILQRSMGWWGEGDDMIYVDGEQFPSLHGTGSEDYFSDAWGMREDENPFYGCPLQESDFQVGSKATVYRFHLPDPIPFEESIKVTIEHGHANNRSDYFSSVAYWYQEEPHIPFPPLPSMEERLPFALESTGDLVLPDWKKTTVKEKGIRFEDTVSGMTFQGENLTHFMTSFYDQDGSRYPVLMTDGVGVGDEYRLVFPVQNGEQYRIDLLFLKGANQGVLEVKEIGAGSRKVTLEPGEFDGYAQQEEIGKLTIDNVLLAPGENSLVLSVAGKNRASRGMEIGLVGLGFSPSSPRFITEWNLIGPFDAPDMTYLQVLYPPEKETGLVKEYLGKDSSRVLWQEFQARESGYMWLDNLFTPNEFSIVYGLVNVFSPDDRKTQILLGSDDGIRVWLNDELVHTNPAYRGAYPDQDRVDVTLKKGWNKVLVKVLQGAGGWGYYFRFVDPNGDLRWSTRQGG